MYLKLSDLKKISFCSFPDGSAVKNSPTMQETQVESLGWEHPLEKEMLTYSNILAWRLPWTEGPGRLQSMGSQRVGHDWVTKCSTASILPNFLVILTVNRGNDIALSIFLSLLDFQDNQDSTITVEGSPYWNNDNSWQPSISCHLPCWDNLGCLSKDLSFSFRFQLPYYEGHYCCFNADVV